MTQTHKTYGLVTALAMIIVNVIFYVTGLTFKTGWAGYVQYVPFLIGIILNAQAYSKANDANVTYGSVFTSGFKSSAITALVLLAWTFLSVYLIFPEMKDKSMEMAAEQMAKNPNMTDEQIEMGLEMTKKFFIPFMVGGVIFGTMFFGAIFSLIGAAFAKRNPAPKA
ncbi:MAG: DUF4199 domain-containing protein [Chitinophagaceae bacterium]|nr:DUF4199 domain-containing protein [Chitinophagaceae bacterium]MCB9044937.1 DUF4199 domain-containing protein [Chitinophagales bacterium]